MTNIFNKSQLDLRSNPNLLINGDFSVWQRGNNLTSGGNFYCADRALARFNSTVQRASNETNPLANTRYCLQIENSESDGIAYLAYSVELTDTGLRYPIKQNQDYTFSQLINAELGADIRVDVIYRDKVQSSTNSVSVVPNTSIGTGTGSWEKLEFTFDTGSIVPVSTNESLVVIITIESSSANVPSYHSEVKLELGSVATPFLPDDPATNLAKCQRYYYRIDSAELGVAWVAVSAKYGTDYNRTDHYVNLPLPVTMRKIPTDREVNIGGGSITTNVATTQNIAAGLSSGQFVVYSYYANAEL